jgi:hypothetical protein
MDLSQQVVSLDLARRLKELGYKQESLFYWDRNGNLYIRLNIETGFMLRLSDRTYHDGTTLGDFIAALTVGELGEMLPGQLMLDDKEHPIHQLITEKSSTLWHCSYICAACMGKLGSQWAETEADARAKMLIYLLENKLYNPS